MQFFLKIFILLSLISIPPQAMEIEEISIVEKPENSDAPKNPPQTQQLVPHVQVTMEEYIPFPIITSKTWSDKACNTLGFCAGRWDYLTSTVTHYCALSFGVITMISLPMPCFVLYASKSFAEGCACCLLQIELLGLAGATLACSKYPYLTYLVCDVCGYKNCPQGFERGMICLPDDRCGANDQTAISTWLCQNVCCCCTVDGASTN